jgi:hypothetical protein
MPQAGIEPTPRTDWLQACKSDTAYPMGTLIDCTWYFNAPNLDCWTMLILFTGRSVSTW